MYVSDRMFVLNFAALGVKFMMVAVKMGEGPGAQRILVVFCGSQSPPSILPAVPCPCRSQTWIVALDNTCTTPRDICILKTGPIRLHENKEGSHNVTWSLTTWQSISPTKVVFSDIFCLMFNFFFFFNIFLKNQCWETVLLISWHTPWRICNMSIKLTR